MTNKLVVIINSLKVPKIKKILLHEMKFLVPTYSCLQSPWLGGYVPRSPFSLSSVLNWICWTPPSPKKIPGYATDGRRCSGPTTGCCSDMLMETPETGICAVEDAWSAVCVKTCRILWVDSGWNVMVQSEAREGKLTLIVLMWRIGWAHNNARK